MKLTAENVNEIFLACLFKQDEDEADRVTAQGVMQKEWSFHPGRLQANQENIMAMLNQLPDPFFANSGAGWSFLMACNTKAGDQWSDLHYTMDQLVILGIAIDRVKFLMPRKYWSMLPGGMPYFVISQDDAVKTEPITP